MDERGFGLAELGRGRPRRSPGPRERTAPRWGSITPLLLSLTAVVLTLADPAAAQEPSSADQARAAAADAQKAARQAQDELEQAQRALEQAKERAAAQQKKADDLQAQADAAAPATPEEAQEAAEKAERRARRAERRADEADRRAQEALDRVQELEARLAYDRTGLYLGASAFYAPEAFDEASSVTVKSSKGASAKVGYRVHSLIALEARVDYLDKFKVSEDDASGRIDGYALTGNLRVFLYPKRFQPWLGFGVGAIRTDFDAHYANGESIHTGNVDTDPVFRFAAGLDTYLTSHLVLTVEAAMNAVTGDRDYINYGQLAVGVDFRF